MNKPTSRIVYLMSGTPHLPYLIASLYTLRQTWKGPVSVYAWPESAPIAQRIAQDKRLGIDCRRWHPTYRGKNAQFLCKQLVMQSLDDTVGIYLDADTTIQGDLTPLVEAALEYNFVATQFNNWTTQNSMIRKRIMKLLEFDQLDGKYITEALTTEWPSVNGGVFACRPNCKLLPVWNEWSEIAKSIFISDETALHAMMPMFNPQNEMLIMPGGKYNCSPMYQPDSLADEDVVIYHYHGDGNVRAERKPRGTDMWWPIWEECLEANYGYCVEWWADCGNKFLNKLTKEKNDG